jgi:hypothetical protein
MSTLLENVGEISSHSDINKTEVLNKLIDFLDNRPYDIFYYNDKKDIFDGINSYQSKSLFIQYNIEMKSGKVNSYLCFNDKKIKVSDMAYDNVIPMMPRYIYPLVISKSSKLEKLPDITGSIILNTEIYGDVYYFLDEFTRDKAFNKLYF